MLDNKFYIVSFLVALQLFFTASLRAGDARIDIDMGMPIGEALYSLISNKYVLISTPLNYTKQLERADAFLLNDDKILYVESKASKQGDTYKIVKMATFNLKDINSVSTKKLIFFKNFDLKKFEGHN